MVVVGEDGVREELVVRFMACTVRGVSDGEETGVTGCEREDGTDEATVLGQHAQSGVNQRVNTVQ